MAGSSDHIITTDAEIAAELGVSMATYYRLLPEMRELGVVLRRVIRKRCADGKQRNFRCNYTIRSLLIKWQMARGGVEVRTHGQADRDPGLLQQPGSEGGGLHAPDRDRPDDAAPGDVEERPSKTKGGE